MKQKTKMNLSIVIICRNGSSRLAETLLSVQGIGNEIILYDSGSTDDSIEIAELFNVTIKHGSWEGYGRNRYKASRLAKYDWILMLDTDEVLDNELREAILKIDLGNENLVYNFRYKNFYGNKHLRYGEWGNDSHIRMANRKTVSIDQEIVHEKLFLQPGLHILTLNGFIHHYTVKDSIDHARKAMEYAKLSAEKYLNQGKHSSIIKMYCSPLFSFIQNYLFKMGFRDGWMGFVCAAMTSWYTFLKYANLKELDVNGSQEVKKKNNNESNFKQQIEVSVT